MKNIQIKKEIKGALEGTTGYVEIASTATRPYVSDLLEDKHGQNKLSSTFASLFTSRIPSLNCLSIIHIQGQRNGIPGRMYDTRIFYEIDADSIRNCDFKIGSIVNSLPRMERYNDIRIRLLSDLFEVDVIQGYNETKALNLAELIFQAIANCEYLLIRLDDNFNWKENGVLENEIAKTLFAAIDKLPKELRPLASFALSIDDNYNKEFLNDKLIILYHGNKNDFGFGKKKQIDWKDLIQKSETYYLKQSEKYTRGALKLMNGATDFFDTNLTFVEILQNLQPISPDDIQKLLINDLNTKSRKGGLDLNDIYNNNLYVSFQKESIAENYAKMYFETKISTLNITKQIEFLQNDISKIFVHDEILAESLKTKIIENILNNLNKDNWFEIAKVLQNSKHEQILKNKTNQNNLSLIKELFENKQFNNFESLIKECFYNSNAYKNNSNELCEKPFILHLPINKKQELRKSHLNNIDNFKELFVGITYAEINQLSIDFKQKIKLLSKNNYGEFIESNRSECEKQFLYEFLNNQDISKGEIFYLYKNAKESFPKIDDITVSVRNLCNAFNNAKTLNIDLSRRIVELYKCCRNIGDVVSILKITNQFPDSDTIKTFNISDIEDLKLLIDYRLPIEKDKIDVRKLIDYIPKKGADQKLRELLEILTRIEIPFSEYEQKIKQLSSKVYKEFFNKQKITPSLLKKGFYFAKTHKVMASVVVIALITGFGGGFKIGYNKGESDAVNVLHKDSTKTQIGDTIINQRNTGLTIVKNDSVSIFFRKQTGKNDIIKVKKESLADWFSIYKVKPLIIDSILLNDSVYHLDFTIDGPGSGTKFYLKIDTLINKK